MNRAKFDSYGLSLTERPYHNQHSKLNPTATSSKFPVNSYYLYRVPTNPDTLVLI